jgi:site-specific DNA-methyltransferase (adenine-specific)
VDAPADPLRLRDPTLLLGDCLDVLPTLEAGSVDVVVTSPPYNLGIAYRSYADRLAEQAYLDWLVDVAGQVRRVMAPDGSFFLNIAGSSKAPWLPFELIVRLRTLFVLQNHITWIKSVAIGEDSVGHFKPVGGRRFLHHNHEHIFHLTLGGSVPLERLAIGVPFKDKSNIARWGHAQDLRCGGNVWFMPYKTVKSKAQKFDHPSGFPVELPLRCIQLHGHANAVVLDPFLGAGTTLVAAERLGLSGVGFEIDRTYAQAARARIEGEREAACQGTRSRS